jgi:hypothetical protein
MGVSRLIVIWLALLTLVGCVSYGTRVPTNTEITDTRLSASRGEVFDAALVVAQQLNLNVGVLEKDSGLIRFDAPLLAPYQLDKYCEYPYVNRSGKPFDTFSNFDTRSQKNGTGPVSGKVTLTVLITDDPAGSNMNMRSSWSASNAKETAACNSTGVFEREFNQSMKAYLANRLAAKEG